MWTDGRTDMTKQVVAFEILRTRLKTNCSMRISTSTVHFHIIVEGFFFTYCSDVTLLGNVVCLLVCTRVTSF